VSHWSSAEATSYRSVIVAAGTTEGVVVQMPFRESRRSQAAFVVTDGAVIERLVAVAPAKTSTGFVVDTPLAISLLGMTFLKRLEGYEIHDGALIVSW